MTPARAQRERFAALAAEAPSATPVASPNDGGQTIAVVLDDGDPSPARAHRLRQAALAGVGPVIIAAAEAIAAVMPSGTTPAREPAPIAPAFPAGRDPVHAQMILRLTHDLRRLKDIQSVERKIDAKREMLPAYVDWCRGVLDAAEATGAVAPDEVLPTIMVWAIDVGDWPLALALAAHVLRHAVPLPARYDRTAPTLIVEEVANVAAKEQALDRRFPRDVLEGVAIITAGEDMPDQVAAKLAKAIGIEEAADAEAMDASLPAWRPAAERALATLRRAQELNDRIGVKERIKRLERALAAAPAAETEHDPAPQAPRPADGIRPNDGDTK